LARETAEVEVRAVDPLHGEAERISVQPLRRLESREMLEQRRRVIPAHPTRARGDVVAESGRDRNRRDRAEGERLREAQVIAYDVVKALPGEVGEIDLVDREHHVPDAEERADVAVPAGLGED